MEKTEKKQKQSNILQISTKSFIVVMVLLIAIIIAVGISTYFIAQGSFTRDENGVIILGSFVQGDIKGYPVWRWFTAPVEVLFSPDGLQIFMIGIFLMIISGAFTVMDKNDGIKIIIDRLVGKFSGKKRLLICVLVFIFMAFGSMFGLFEELVTLMPIMIMLMLSLGLDTLTGMGVCLVAACFGFSSAITNPFSVGIASDIAGISMLSGVWMRILMFVLIFAVLCGFLLIHYRRITKDPRKSLTYEQDQIKRERLNSENTEMADKPKVFKVYSVFFSCMLLFIVLIAAIPFLSKISIPLLALGFLVGGILSGYLINKSLKRTLKEFLTGAVSMLPAFVMIAFASSVKYILVSSNIMDHVIYTACEFLGDKSPFVCVLLLYAFILFLQIFIGSASAKVMMIMPIILPICAAVGITDNIAILTYVIADGFTDVILPTNAVLLIALSIADVSYFKWFRWTILLQVAILLLTVIMLYFGVLIGY